MPHTGMNYEGGGAMCHNTCKISDRVPGAGLVNGAVAHNGWPAAAMRTRERPPAGTLPVTKPHCVVNGFINHGYKGKSTWAAPPRTHRKCGGVMLAATDASAAGRVSSAGIPGGTLSASLDAVASPCDAERMAPQHSLSATAKNPRRKERFRRKKKADFVPLLLPPQEEEDWEKEIQEAKVTECGNNRLYGLDDALHFSFCGLALHQRVDLPVAGGYIPAVHHQRPIHWSRCFTRTEPDQFTDADE